MNETGFSSFSKDVNYIKLVKDTAADRTSTYELDKVSHIVSI